eukprot:gene17973-24378_t
MYRVFNAAKALGNLRLARAAAASASSGLTGNSLAQTAQQPPLISAAWATGPMTLSRGFSMAAVATASGAPATKMFCYQCEQTQAGTGCTTVGMCGKSPEVAGLQDLLIYSLKGLGSVAHHARAAGVTDSEVDSFLNRALFSTLTNVNFDDQRFYEYINHSAKLQARLQAKMVKPHSTALPEGVNWFINMPHPAQWNADNAKVDVPIHLLMEVSKEVGIVSRQEALGKTTAGLQELLMYGLKGMAAYAAHAEALGSTDPEVSACVQEIMDYLCSPKASEVPALLETAMKLGKCNYRVMQMLSEAHSNTFGHPVPTEVSLTPVAGKCLLVTGHDMHDMELVLKQTEGKGINVYTHGEMLPAHSYPGLKKYAHLKGHFGGAWYRQKMDFSYFPGSILVTTNCVLEPMAMYKNNIYTTNETGVAGVKHLDNKDFSEVINKALEMKGFSEANMNPKFSGSAGGRGGGADAPTNDLKKTVTVGFGHNAVLGVADQVIDAVKTGKLSHIFLIGGCDGHEPQRAYYSQLAKVLPTDTMVLTLGCGKFRIFDQPFGDLPGTGLPRLLDMGQCNDAYSALVVATELSKAFDCSVNDLPLSIDISWFEQKAVSILLTLLSLGVKNIRLGPVLPAFLTADAVQVLVDNFDLKAADTTNPEHDLMKMLKKN